MKSLIYLLIVLVFASCASQETARERKTLFDDSWKFAQGDYAGADQATFDDKGWRDVCLPHDWSIELATDINELSGNDGGYYPTGIGWYRKHLRATANDIKRHLELYFEGVYMNSQVYVNGTLAKTHAYGFSGFFCDMTNLLKEGDNVIAVRVDNSQQKNCRWYTGSGIYRHVWLYSTSNTHIDPWGVNVITREADSTEATIEVGVGILHPKKTLVRFDIRLDIREKGADTVMAQYVLSSIATNEDVVAKKVIKISEPKLWSPATPVLYELTASIMDNDKVLDSQTETFGIRQFTCDAENGFVLNGQKMILNGGCLHHDNGMLGTMAFDDAEIRKARLMKEAGFNAARTSHNHPSERFLQACDELGLLVVDEAFDGWREAKNDHDYSTLIDSCWQEDLDALVRRDINHPSVFCWSIGNEVLERKSKGAVETAKMLAGRVHEIDGSRPVTSALASWDSDWEIYDSLAAAHDIVGYNYLIHYAESDHRRVPERVMMQTESFPRDAFANWQAVSGKSYVIGDFVWTAIDYLGESGIGRYYYKGQTEGEHWQSLQYPWHGAYCGDIDITGWRKPISHYRETLYNEDTPTYMAVREPNGYYGEIKETLWSVWPTWESWNWEGWEGKPVDVEVYSRQSNIKLYLDGELMCEKECGRKTEYKATFSMPYKPGQLMAVAYDKNGAAKDTAMLVTAGQPKSIRLTIDQANTRANRQSLSYVVAEIVDADGNVCPNASNEMTFEVDGPADIIATGSADLTDKRAYGEAGRQAWKGRAMVVVRSTGKAGKVVVKAQGEALASASVSIDIR